MWEKYQKVRKYLILSLVLCMVCALSEAAELKEDVIKELASDLADINKVVTASPQPAAIPRAPTEGAQLCSAEDLSYTSFVAGKVSALKPQLYGQVAARGLSADQYVATWAGAFKPDAQVMPYGFVPKGEIRTAQDPSGKKYSWAPAEIVQDAIENKIKDAITKLEQLKKKYAGKGLVVKGFSLSLPVISVSVNFEFE